MASRKVIKSHLLLKSISPSNLIRLCSRTHGRSAPFSRPICTRTHQYVSSSLSADRSKIVDDVISIFIKAPFRADSQELRDFGPKLTTDIVEAALMRLKNWRIAHMFFNWASDQPGYRHSCYTYNAMASILSRARQNAPLRVLALDIVNSRCWLTPGALGFFIRCLGGQGLIEEANVFFDQVKEAGLCVPNNYSYNCLLEAISKSSSIDSIEIRLKEMLDLGWIPDKHTLTPVLQCYCNAGKFENALSVFNQLSELGSVDAHVLSILVLSFSKWGEIDKAFELIERMEDRGINLNNKTFCVLIHGFVRMSRVDKAFQLFEKMQKFGFSPDISLYNSLIGGLCKNKELEKALHLYSEMVELGIHPDVEILTKLISSFPSETGMIQLIEERQNDLDSGTMTLLHNSVLNGLVNSGSIDKAYNLLRAMMGYEFDGDLEVDKLFMFKEAVRPDANSFKIVIDALCQTHEVDLALGLFQDMDQIGCKKSLLLYNNLIGSLCNGNRLEECYDLLREMKQTGFKPTQFTHNSIFGCLCGREDVAGASTVLREMRVHGHEPWIKHYTLLVKRLCKHGRAVEASNFLASMVEEGFLPDIIAYSAAVDGFLKIQEVDRALELFRDICARGYCPDVVAYNIIINGLCKAGRVLESENVLNQMLQKGLVPSVVTYNLLIDGWCKNGDVDKAFFCLSRMVKEERDPNIITFTTLIDGLCNAGRPNDAVALWNEMKGRGCSPNRIAFMALIHGLCKCGKPDAAVVYFQEMEKKEMTPDAFVYVALIDAFISNSDTPLAFDILKRLVHSGTIPEPIDKNYIILRDAIVKLSEDARTSTSVKSLIAEGRFPTILRVSVGGDESGIEPTA